MEWNPRLYGCVEVKRIELERRRRRWTQTQLAAAAGIHQAQVSLIENGRALPSTAQLARLSNALRIPARELLVDIHEPEAQESP